MAREIDFDVEDVGLRSNLAVMRSTCVRATLLFGGLVVALSLVFLPALSRTDDRFAAIPNLDTMITGSIDGGGGGSQTYVLRRSVLQAPDSAPCVVDLGAPFASGC